MIVMNETDYIFPTIILMGVCGCGKTTIGKQLAAMLDGQFFDGDDYHPASNIDKMSHGIALNDTDRKSWLDSLCQLINSRKSSGEPTIVACSSLKSTYRQQLRSCAVKTQFVYLRGDRQTILQRMQNRANQENHFMPASLIDSQFAILEEPVNAIQVDISSSPEEICPQIIAAVKMTLGMDCPV
ncbi:gluconokinase [Persicirhabdus sediminis]|nr:gluconokinase [Persicirhabdus sediminis]